MSRKKRCIVCRCCLRVDHERHSIDSVHLAIELVVAICR